MADKNDVCFLSQLKSVGVSDAIPYITVMISIKCPLPSPCDAFFVFQYSQSEALCEERHIVTR